MKYKINKTSFSKACKNSGGIISIIAERMNAGRTATYDYINKHKFAEAMVLEERSKTKDLAETNLIQLIKAKDFKAIQFFLRTIGKNRGFVEKQEIEHTGGFTNNMRIEVIDYAEKTSTKQKAKKSMERSKG